MKKTLIFLLITAAFSARSQDTLKIMHYNLLNYGNYTSYCTTGNNNHEEKDGWIKTIIDYELPDIFTVNEISRYEFYHNRILNSVLNTGGRTWYSKGPVSNQAGSDLVNMLYYNAQKLVLTSHEVVQSYIRDIDLYSLYFLGPDLERGDTVFIHCLVAHLKAGSYAGDENDRAEMTLNLISYLKARNKPGNYLLLGDLNTYSSSETCYQNLISLAAGEFRFFDPVSKPGDWSGNSAFAQWHTQSVTTVTAGCQSTGGMDDRFDHIMITAQLVNGTKGLRYLSGSYQAVGQDGKHFNKSITDFPANTSVPASVLSAIYNNSDHLPVRIKLILAGTGPGSVDNHGTRMQATVFTNPAGIAILKIITERESMIDLSFHTMAGQVVLSEKRHLDEGLNEIVLQSVSSLSRGVYILRLSDSQGRTASLKMVR